MPGKLGLDRLRKAVRAFLWKVPLKTRSRQGQGSAVFIGSPSAKKCQMPGSPRTAGRWNILFPSFCFGRNLSSRHLGCKCCAKFRQDSLAPTVSWSMQCCHDATVSKHNKQLLLEACDIAASQWLIDAAVRTRSSRCGTWFSSFEAPDRSTWCGWRAVLFPLLACRAC